MRLTEFGKDGVCKRLMVLGLWGRIFDGKDEERGEHYKRYHRLGY
jgi:hypothetical protein